MKKTLLIIIAVSALYGCAITKTEKTSDFSIGATLDLVEIKDDKVQVVIDPGNISSNTIKFFIPAIVQGTYSVDNYGRFLEDFKAIDHSGNELKVIKEGENSWKIANAERLDKITYFVNDTYDLEGEGGIFSPTGTNIDAGKNFMLNLHGFVGYFEGLEESAYRLEIKSPEGLIPGTALQIQNSVSVAKDSRIDTFEAERYFEVTDNPIMYSLPDTASFKLKGMEVLLNVYSPNKIYSSSELISGVQEMITAQKEFLGEIDNTDKYAILLYLSDPNKIDADGAGALEHHTSTVVNFSENIAPEILKQAMVDVVSHEFFHILTPLNIHSQEIHNFDYNEPEMSRHLWMYEGVTEYFAHLFQINQGLIREEEFYSRLVDKIEVAANYDETVPFTVMSRNILEKEYNETFYNVYNKGALIAMALDIHLRELSNGKTGILDLMKDLSERYGKDKPFKDEILFDEIGALTYPEISSFFTTYVEGPTPMPYDGIFEKVGLELITDSVETGYLVKGKVPYIDIDTETGYVFFRNRINYNSFLEELGVQGGDIIKEINGTPMTAENAGLQLRESLDWKPGTEVNILVERDGQEMKLKSVAGVPTEKVKHLVEKELPESHPAVQLRKAWLYK